MSLLDPTVNDLAVAPFPPKPAATVWRPAEPEWDDLTVAEAIEELRLGDQSRYFPDFADDPCIPVDCPNDGRVTVNAEGFCQWGCGYDFTQYGGLVSAA